MSISGLQSVELLAGHRHNSGTNLNTSLNGRVPALPLTGFGSAHPEPGEGHIRGIFLKNLFLKLTPVPFSVVEYTALASWAFLVSSS